MIRRTFLALVGASILVPAVTAAQGLKIGYIHSEAIIAQDPDARAAQAQFREEIEPWENELEILEEEIANLLDAYQAQEVTLTPEARRGRQRAIIEKQEAYEARRAQIEQAAAERQEELVQPIMESINRVIQQLRDEENYTFIFDASAGGLIAADEAYDLTDEVLARIAEERGGGG